MLNSFNAFVKKLLGYICLIESKFKDNLEEMKKIGGKKIVAKGKVKSIQKFR